MRTRLLAVFLFGCCAFSVFGQATTTASFTGDAVVGPGNAIQYEFRATSSQPFVITVHMPGQTTLTFHWPTGAACRTLSAPAVGSGGDIVCSTSGSVYEIFDYIVSADVASGTVLHASATFDFGADGSVTRTVDTTVLQSTSLTMNASTPAATAGVSYPMTVTVTNSGSAIARSVQASFRRTGGNFAAWPQKHLTKWTCHLGTSLSDNHTLMLCFLPDLAPGATTTDTIDVDADPSASSDTVHVTWAATNAAGQAADITTPLSSVVTPTASSVIEPTSPHVGANYHFKPSIQTTGPSLHDFTFSYVTPPNTVFISATTPAGVTCTYPASGAAGEIRCSAAILQGVTQTWPTTYPSYALDLVLRTDVLGNVTNTASMSASNGTSAPVTTSSTALISENTLELTTSFNFHDPGRVLAGDTVQADLTFTNIGSSPAAGASVDVALPPGGGVVPDKYGSDLQCTSSAQAAHCLVPTIPANSARTFSVHVQAPPAAGNAAYSFTANGIGVALHTYTATLNVLPRDVRLQATCTVLPAKVRPTDTFNIVIDVTNSGADGALGAAVHLPIPPSFTVLAVTASSATCTVGADVTCTYPTPLWSRVELQILARAVGPAGTSTPITATMTSFTASVAASATVAFDTNPGDVQLNAAFGISEIRVLPGQDAGFELTLSNNGADPSGVLQLSVTTPAGLTLDRFVYEHEEHLVSTRQLNFTIPLLGPHRSTILTLDAHTDKSALGRLPVTASVSGFGVSAGPVVETVVLTPPVSSLTAAIDPGRTVVIPGDTVTYGLRVVNGGPDPADNASLNVTVTGGTLQSFVPAIGSCSIVASTLSCAGLSLYPGNAFDLAFTVVAGNNAASVTAAATVMAPSAATRTVSVTTPVLQRGLPDLAVTVAGTSPTVIAGQTVTALFSVTNVGGSAINDVTFDATTSSNLVFTSGSITAGPCAGTHCMLGTLSAGATAVVTVKATASGAGAAWITGAASTTAAEVSLSNDTAEVTLNVVLPRNRAAHH